jgi:hypothetical protein
MVAPLLNILVLVIPLMVGGVVSDDTNTVTLPDVPKVIT